MTLAVEVVVLLEEDTVCHVFTVSVWLIFATRAVKVLPEWASTVNVACWPTLILPMSVSSTFAMICFFERSAMRMMTVG